MFRFDLKLKILLLKHAASLLSIILHLLLNLAGLTDFVSAAEDRMAVFLLSLINKLKYLIKN